MMETTLAVCVCVVFQTRNMIINIKRNTTEFIIKIMENIYNKYS